MAKELLIEYNVFTPIISINEGVRGTSGNLIVSGLLSTADKPNQNKRIYPFDTMYEQVGNYIENFVKGRGAYGEVDHPDRSTVELKTASHIITELWWEGKDLYGKVEILPTPSGNILKALFENKLRVGISSRALGSVTPLGEGVVKVEDDLDLIAWDFVSNPSNMGSYMHTQKSAGLRESVEYNTKSSHKYSRINSIIGDLLCSYSGQCCLR